MNKKLILPEGVEKEQEASNVVPFEASPVTKPDWLDTISDWLWRFPVGTVFLVKTPPEKDAYGRNVYSPQLMELHVDMKEASPNSVKLLSNLNSDQYMWVDSELFSKAFTLQKVLYRPEE